MKKTLLSTLMAFALLCSANAQIDIEGIYSGEVVIDASNFLEPLIQSENIIIEKDGDFYTLKINNFTLLDPDTQEDFLLIGLIEFTGIEASLQGENIVLSKAGISNGPIVYDIMPTTIKLVSCKITPDGEMIANLSVDAYMRFDGDESLDGWDINNINLDEWYVFIDVTVDFTGSRETSSICSPKAQTIAVYPTIVDNEITVTGFESANYAIYAQNGALVKVGNVNNGIINVASLGTGIYFLNINGTTAKFIKK